MFRFWKVTILVIDDDMSSRRDLFVRALGNQNQIILNSGVTIGHVEGGTLTLSTSAVSVSEERPLPPLFLSPKPR